MPCCVVPDTGNKGISDMVQVKIPKYGTWSRVRLLLLGVILRLLLEVMGVLGSLAGRGGGVWSSQCPLLRAAEWCWGR